MEPFKHLLGPDLIRATGMHLKRVHRRFDRTRFEALALDGLEGLEMKARAMHIASALQATLPSDFDAAAGCIEAALGDPVAVDAPAGAAASDTGLAGWVVWPLGEFIVREGNTPGGERLPRAMQALHALTQRFSAEFAIRPFVRDHPQPVFDTLSHWLGDPSAHVRRLVSEGTRPRLPWGLRLQALVADPSPSLPLLQALQDDSSAYVRRSVANHLNDIARDHPARLHDWLSRHLGEASPERRALLRHASRSLIKAGDAPTLALWGTGAAFQGEVTLQLARRRVSLGEALPWTLRLVSQAREPQPLVIDYAVHHVKADGSTRPKVFKGWTRTLAPGEVLSLERQHPLREITTRRYHAGTHRLELRLNGQPRAEAEFELRL